MTLQIFGNLVNMIGAVFLIASYIPQITMLLKTKNSDNLSPKFWVILNIGMTGLLVNMIIVKAGIFVIGTQIINIALAIVVLILVVKYKKRA